MSSRECSKCCQVKELSEFQQHKKSKDGHRAACKACGIANAKSWAERNPERRKAIQNAWNRRNRAKMKDCHLQREYGISLEQYKEWLAAQKECCAICKRHQSEFKIALAVDHDHETGEVRGLLCKQCNIGIGLLGESRQNLTAAIEYLSSVEMAV